MRRCGLSPRLEWPTSNLPSGGSGELLEVYNDPTVRASLRVCAFWIGVVWLTVTTAAAKSASSKPVRAEMAIGPIIQTVQAANGQAPCTTTCGLPGSATGGMLSVNWSLSPRVDTGGEVIAGGSRQGREVSSVPGGRIESTATQSDATIGGVVRGTLTRPEARFQVKLVAGVGVTYRETNRKGPFRLVDGNPTNGLAVKSSSTWIPTADVGLDLPFKVFRSVSIVPTIRASHLFSDDESERYPVHGLGNLIWSTGLRVAIAFPRN